MAYNLGDRFPPPPKYFRFYDPGTYQFEEVDKILLPKAPFLSNTPRKTQAGMKAWTHALYNVDVSRKIPNCTSLMSKLPRFPYEAFSKEDLEELLCKCGVQKPCECLPDENLPEVICQGKVKRRIFKGPPPRSVCSDEGLSAPSKKEDGFDILPDGSKRRRRKKESNSPPFYNVKVSESTAFYQGCKWSQWSSKRSKKSLEVRPGPAHYILEREPNKTEICSERFREYRRSTSKQPRFIEIIQQRNILEGRPSPATYSPNYPKGTDLKYIGPKAERFPNSQYDIRPGPADHWLRRDFEPVALPEKVCHAHLPQPACFGNKALRFKPRHEEGPSPVSYCSNYKPCQFIHCPTTPFGSSSKRFKEDLIEESDEESIPDTLSKEEDKKPCPTPTWEFKSKTIRMKPLVKKIDEASPADLPQSIIKVERSPQLQYTAPFYSSEGRFQPWYNWLPVHGKEKTPGPCRYCLEKPSCLPAVTRGPLCRVARFYTPNYQTPAPNAYEVSGGIEIILQTHNQRLVNNIKNQHTFYWSPPVDRRKLSPEEKENLFLERSIALLETDFVDIKGGKITKNTGSFKEELKKPKLLRCFVSSNKVPPSF